MDSEAALMGVYRRFPVTLARGQGVHLWDHAGRHYWDFLAGIGVNSLGHHHPRVVGAIAESLPLLHTSNLYFNQPQTALAGRLHDLSGGFPVFFANSGTEANEAGIKLIRRWGQAQGRYRIVVFRGGFHGRTLGSLAATPEPAYQDPFRPLPEGFIDVPYGDLDALQQALVQWQPAAVMVEAIQGEAGVVVPPPEFLPELVERSHRAGSLVLVDEVQTGMGRTGHWFAFQHHPLQPDLITLAKGLGGGVPIGALLATPEVAACFRPGDHGSTFGGNPMATRVGLAVVEWLEAEGLAHVREMAPFMEATLTDMAARFPEIVEGVRGRGLMWGLVLRRSSASYAAKAFEQGLLINATGGNILRFLPPLVVDAEAIGAMGDILARVLSE